MSFVIGGTGHVAPDAIYSDNHSTKVTSKLELVLKRGLVTHQKKTEFCFRIVQGPHWDSSGDSCQRLHSIQHPHLPPTPSSGGQLGNNQGWMLDQCQGQQEAGGNSRKEQVIGDSQVSWSGHPGFMHTCLICAQQGQLGLSHTRGHSVLLPSTSNPPLPTEPLLCARTVFRTNTCHCMESPNYPAGRCHCSCVQGGGHGATHQLAVKW